ncbi:NAD(P)-dependent alcohol dehydrogenase [Oceanomicrobium pacificus]|uniref:Zinc-binding dehydrogenase n=1 Tax=Oceanomicrobium pacificus TaxID=2692916 RepID=A0A6B0TSR2_9RHOB|nr:NAD(P)-dependent alcohol dehydrogenase [Oceanomicrobium pacificus]MXU64252.1 zinc-binding dehydrogenase [Oceanomicrobium pacificus]
MKAAVHDAYGGPEVLRLDDLPVPEPKPGEIRIRVMATTVNRTDCGFRAATPFITRAFTGLTRPKFRVLGNEVAGIVDKLGDGVTGFQVGQAVVGMTGDPGGGQAEYLCMKAKGAVGPKPRGLSFIEAVTLLDGPMLARAYVRAIAPARGMAVLVNGASGSIGLNAVQWLRHLAPKGEGMVLDAVCKTGTVDLLHDLGAERVYDYKREDFTATDARYDVIFDAVGRSRYRYCRPLLKDGGTYMSTELGPGCENPLLALRSAAFGGRKKIRFPLPGANRKVLDEITALAEAGALRPMIDRVLPLEEIVAATEYVESEEKVGTVVILPNPLDEDAGREV